MYPCLNSYSGLFLRVKCWRGERVGKTCFKQEKRDLIPEGSVVRKTTNGGGLSRVNGQISFSITDIEQLMWNAVLDTFQRAMVELLSTLDVYLMATRDKNRYEYKERCV